MFVSGFVSVSGRPNVGKSTLINTIMNRKLLITSDKPQTTRDEIHAIYTSEDVQVIFVDTPGIHKPRHQLGNFMVKTALENLKEMDVLLFIVEATAPPGRGDKHIASLIRELDIPLFLVVNKYDLAPVDFEEKWLPLYLELADFERYFLLSALKGEKVEGLLHALKEFLPEGPLYYPADMLLDRPQYFVAAEIIREKVLHKTRDEVPHAVAVEIHRMENRAEKNLTVIEAVIYVERDSQKKIIIGREGKMLKEIGREARMELESTWEQRVFLDLWVKVKKDWRHKDNILRQLGYK